MSLFETQSNLNFPMSLAEKYRPRALSDFVGLEKIKRTLSKFAAQPYPSAWLAVGPAGCGKTSAGLALCETMHAELHKIPSQQCNIAAVEEVIRVCHYVSQFGGMHFVLVDEADKMSAAAALHFLSKLDATGFPPQTVFYFTCNSTEGLEPRFLSRTRQLEFSSYGMAGEASQLLAKVWECEAGNAPAPNFAQIVRDCRNNLRDCLMTLETEILAA